MDLVIVVNQLRIVLVGLAAQKAHRKLEAAAQRPTLVGPGSRNLIRRGQVPFADGVGVVSLLEQDFREESIFEGNIAVGAG